MSKIAEIVQNMLDPIMIENNYELVDVEFVKEGSTWYLRVFIDKEGGITIDDCEQVSRALDQQLEENDPIAHQYILEVSSPGIDRPLKTDKDLTKNIGNIVEVKLFQQINKCKEFSGELIEYTDDIINIELENEEAITFERKNIAVIRLAIIF